MQSKRFAALLTATAVFMGLFAGCAKGQANGGQTKEPEQNTGAKPVVYTSIFPTYDFTRRLAAEDFDVQLLVPPGSEAHDWEPSAKDMARITEAQGFIFSGAGMEGWAEQVLSAAKDSKLKALEASKGLDLIKAEHHHGDGEHADAHHHEGHEHAAIQEKDVEQRAMSEFGGAYKSLGLVFESGALDKAIEASAKKEGHSFDEEKAEVLKHYKTDYPYIKVDGEKLQLTDKDGKVQEEASYEAKGFNFESHGDHAHVWYQYEKKSGSEKLPKYLLFNDHGYKANQPKEEGHLAHIHLLYGNESFEKTLEQDTVPFYVDAAVKDEVLQEIFAPEEEHEHAEEGHSHEHGEEGHHHHHHGPYDPHVWLSPKNVQGMMKNIAAFLQELKPEAKDAIQARLDENLKKLEDLDKSYSEALKPYKGRKMIVGHEAFGYICRDYGLEQYGIEGLLSESEPSPGHMAELVKVAKENGIRVIFTEPLGSSKTAETIAKEIGATVETLDPYEGPENADAAKTADYFKTMEENLAKLKKAFS